MRPQPTGTAPIGVDLPDSRPKRDTLRRFPSAPVGLCEGSKAFALGKWEKRHLLVGRLRMEPRDMATHEQFEGSTQVGPVCVAELAAAIGEHQLTVHYQPIVDLRTGRTLAVEALARWRHPVRGFVPPLEFIELAETSGLIGAVTRAIVDQVREQLTVWRASGRDLECAINISPHALADEGNSEALVQSLIAMSGQVTVEVTESATASVEAVFQLTRLAAAGIPAAIDDFGTGYSCIGALKALPVGTLKIDRSLLKDIEFDRRDFDIAQGVVALARSFGLNVIAEGIETEGAAERLLEAGIVQGQGFWFARPMPAADLEHWLDSQPFSFHSPRHLAKQQVEFRNGFCAHGVVPYASEAELVADVAEYISEALILGDRALVIATAQRRVAVLERLAPEVRRVAEQSGLMSVLDAQETLGLISREGVPDSELFDLHVGAVVRSTIKGNAGLSVYGEMVSLLWRAGNVIGALKLEDLWNSLQRKCNFSLLCAYPLTDPVGAPSAGLAQICLDHSAMRSAHEPAPVLRSACPQEMHAHLTDSTSLHAHIGMGGNPS